MMLKSEEIEGIYYSNITGRVFEEKNGVEDLKKAKVYLEKLISEVEEK